MKKQMVYVIIKDDELFSMKSDTHFFWTKLISYAKIFENRYLADKQNKELHGTVMRLKYEFENSKLWD